MTGGFENFAQNSTTPSGKFQHAVEGGQKTQVDKGVASMSSPTLAACQLSASGPVAQSGTDQRYSTLFLGSAISCRCRSLE